MPNDNFKLAASSALLSIAVICSLPTESRAQYKPKLPVKKENVDTVDKLQDKVAIDGLPDYSGKQKFITGRKFMSQSGPQYVEEFLAMEQPNVILEWYKNALSSYKWEVTYSDNFHVSAKKPNGTSVSIMANPEKSPDGRSRVKISYHEFTSTK